ncbi:hypothetical protein GLYMA_13G080950v4 [Glycine max]|nr:hypothetical protein GLYMA_13G080950v4 [Glycine max]KAH1100367.1 hypothetical protein GYH30_035502 [Glycine max]
MHLGWAQLRPLSFYLFLLLLCVCDSSCIILLSVLLIYDSCNFINQKY